MVVQIQADPQTCRRRQHTRNADAGNARVLRNLMSQQCAAAYTDVVKLRINRVGKVCGIGGEIQNFGNHPQADDHNRRPPYEHQRVNGGRKMRQRQQKPRREGDKRHRARQKCARMFGKPFAEQVRRGKTRQAVQPLTTVTCRAEKPPIWMTKGSM